MRGAGAHRHFNYRATQAVRSILGSKSKSSITHSQMKHHDIRSQSEVYRSDVDSEGFEMPRRSFKQRSEPEITRLENELAQTSYTVPVQNRFTGNF